jgi:hypothetical protein
MATRAPELADLFKELLAFATKDPMHAAIKHALIIIILGLARYHVGTCHLGVLLLGDNS